MSTDAKPYLIRRARDLGIRVNSAWSPKTLKEAIRRREDAAASWETKICPLPSRKSTVERRKGVKT